MDLEPGRIILSLSQTTVTSGIGLSSERMLSAGEKKYQEKKWEWRSHMTARTCIFWKLACRRTTKKAAAAAVEALRGARGEKTPEALFRTHRSGGDATVAPAASQPPPPGGCVFSSRRRKQREKEAGPRGEGGDGDRGDYDGGGGGGGGGGARGKAGSKQTLGGGAKASKARPRGRRRTSSQRGLAFSAKTTTEAKRRLVRDRSGGSYTTSSIDISARQHKKSKHVGFQQPLRRRASPRTSGESLHRISPFLTYFATAA